MSYQPVDADRLPSVLASYLIRLPGRVRVALDGADCTAPDALADRLAHQLQADGRAAIHVRADHFWRDASLRLEHGRTDDHALRHEWLDVAAVRREVLDPLGPGGSGAFLPSLRDPLTNRATREPARFAPDDLVLVVSGQLLLGLGLPFDRVIRLSASPAALARRTPAERAWQLPVIAAYEAELDPSTTADVDIRVNDPRHPAIRIG